MCAAVADVTQLQHKTVSEISLHVQPELLGHRRTISLIDKQNRTLGGRRISRELRKRQGRPEGICKTGRGVGRALQLTQECKRRRGQQLNKWLAGGSRKIGAKAAAHRHPICERYECLRQFPRKSHAWSEVVLVLAANAVSVV